MAVRDEAASVEVTPGLLEVEPVLELAQLLEVEPVLEVMASESEAAVSSAEAVGQDDDASEDEDEEQDLDEPGPIEIVDDLSLDGAVDEFETMTSESADSGLGETVSADSDSGERASTADRDPFDTFVMALEETATAVGADERHVTCVRALFGATRWSQVDPGEQAIEALVAGHVIVRSEHRSNALSRSGTFTEQVLAWQGILRGETEDFTVCTALDEWAADVIARVLGNPCRADAIRRELRRRGIAAFGLVAEAA